MHIRFLLVLIIVFPLFLSGQTESHALPFVPWSGDWLPARQDLMVNGEDYMGYPGPMTKFFYALGYDEDHPAMGYNLRYLLDRDAPYWYGQCNGWACAAILYDPPEASIVNGVKLLVPELKGLLSTIWKDTSATIIAGSPSTGAMTPLEVERALNGTIPTGEPVIFDTDDGEEKWNFPIYGYVKTTSTQDEWTTITYTVSLVQPVSMRFQTDVPQLSEVEYKFRHDGNGKYEWISTKRPDVAWRPIRPYYRGDWQGEGNRYINYNLYKKHTLLEANYRDLSEPNDVFTSAKELKNQLILGCLPESDVDYFKTVVQPGFDLEFTLNVYDGSGVEITLFDDGENQLAHYSDTSEQFISYSPSLKGPIWVRIQAAQESSDPIFYKLLFPLDAGSFNSDLLFVNPLSTLSVINADGGLNNLLSSEISHLPGNGSHKFQQIPTSRVVSKKRPIFVHSSSPEGTLPLKSYTLDHQHKTNYIIPHLAFKYGWETTLAIKKTPKTEAVHIDFYDQLGSMLNTFTVPMDGNEYEGDFRDFISQKAADQSAWCEIRPVPEGLIDGFVTFSRSEIGDRVRLPLKSAPKFGENIFCDLKTETAGWNGLVIVNTSGIDNELLFRVVDKNGVQVEDGLFYMQPGEKFISTVASMLQEKIEEGHTLKLFSQYQVEYFYLTHEWGQELSSYVNRGASIKADYKAESNLWIPEDYSSTFIQICNMSSSYEHILFEGYDLAGNLQGRFNVEIGNPIDPYQTIKVPVQQIFENGAGVKDVASIRNLKLYIPEDLLVWEMVKQDSNRSFDCVELPVIFPLMSSSKRQNGHQNTSIEYAIQRD